MNMNEPKTIRADLRRSLEVMSHRNGRLVGYASREMIDFSSNDYLGLSQHPAMKEACLTSVMEWGTGAGASRLMSGNLAPYKELEEALASFKGTEAALVFGSGYLANLGVLTGLCRRGDRIFMDRLCHASLVDGAVLSRCRLRRFGHNDLDALERLLKEDRPPSGNKTVVVVESLYSMDGDPCPLVGLLELKSRYRFMLIVDEAHAIGLFGQGGVGLIPRSMAPLVDVHVGTFGKALGGYGAFAALGGDLRQLLVNRARSFIFSTALPPGVLASNLQGLRLCGAMGRERGRVLSRASWLRNRLREITAARCPGRSQIVPLVVGGNLEAVRIARGLARRGIFARAIRPPTVPEGTARLRFSITALHGREDLELLLEALGDLL